MREKVQKILSKLKNKMFSIEVLVPVEQWHTNAILKVPKGASKDSNLHDLPITQLGDKVISIWKVQSFMTRVKFLLTGKVNFQILAPTHHPIQISIGEYEQE